MCVFKTLPGAGNKFLDLFDQGLFFPKRIKVLFCACDQYSLVFYFSGKFEAVYYHMRCLQTKTPVETSRQSLVEIFEDIRKRWDVSEKKRLEDRAQRKKDADR